MVAITCDKLVKLDPESEEIYMHPETIAKRSLVLKRAKRIAAINAKKLRLKKFFYKHPLADAIAEVDAETEF